MMAVSLSETEALRYIEKHASGAVVVACVNSPSSQTLSGDETAIDEIQAALAKDDIFARKLKVDTAYHSHHMQLVAQDYQEAINGIGSGQVRNGVTFYSSVTGAIKSTGFDANYWTSNLVSQVKFSHALALLRNDQMKQEANVQPSVFIEIGPHSVLAGPSRQTLTQGEAKKINFEYLSPLLRNNDALRSTLTFVGKLFEIGLELDMSAVLDITSGMKSQIIRDLKSYPWDLAPYWRESRLSKAHRFRQFPHHDLLGLFDPASTIYEPRWKHFLNLNALPWLQDHIVEGFVIYPGAGYFSMAMEAMNQLSQMRGSQKPIVKFILRDVAISKALVLREPEDSSSSEVEVQLSMCPANKHEGNRWESFKIRSCNADGSWSEHCSGDITVEYESSGVDEVEGNREMDLRHAEAISFLETARQGCDTSMTKSEFYDYAKLSGNEFRGPFTSIEQAKHGNNRGVFELRNPDIGSLMPHGSFRPHIIHPTTLDVATQINGILFKRFVKNATCVAAKIPLLELDAKISTTPGDILTGAMQIEADGPQASNGEGWVFQKGTDGVLRPVIRLVIKLRAISEALEDQSRPFVQDKVNRLDWNLDVDFLTEASFRHVLSSTLGLDENTTYGYGSKKVSIEEAQKGYLIADQAASIWMRHALRYIEAGNNDKVPTQLMKFFGWMKRWLNSDACHKITSGLDTEEESHILQSIESATDSAELQLLSRVGKVLPDILTGAVEPLTVMLEGNLLARNYESGTFTGDYEAAVAYLKLLTFKNPRLRFLEIGAGTGGCTKSLFNGLTGQNGASGLPVEQYTFTDISSGFFEEARETFAQWDDVLEFKTLDADKDPIEQGFEAESYDVVVAANVLHATRKIDVTMSRVRKLLKPGGSLVLLEVSPRGATVGLVAGTLTGWWAHEDEFRIDTPLLHRDQWADVLSRNGFGGIQVSRGSMMVSKATASLPSNGTQGRHDAIVVRHGIDYGLDKIITGLASHDIDATGTSWDQIKTDQEGLYIVLDCTETSLLVDPSPELFMAIKALLSANSRVLWVVLQDTADPASSAYAGLANVLMRVLRRECGNTSLITLDIRYPAPQPEQTAAIIADVARRCFWPSSEEQRSLEPEFAWEDGRMLNPRVKPDGEFLKWARAGRTLEAATEMETVPFHSRRVLKANVATLGLISSLRFIDDDVSPTVEPSQIVVKADAHGVNYKDVCVALGQMAPSITMAGEFAGIVRAVAEDMRHVYEVGDRVMGFGAQPFSNLPHTHGFLAHKIPEWMSVTVAASIPHAYATAYHCIMEIGRLKSGQSVLVHAASGAVGQAAIQLAQHVGATIFCIVSTAAKRQLLVEDYGIPESHIFSSRTGSLKHGIMRLTNGEGVHLVLNSSTGEVSMDSLNCVKTLGTFIELGHSQSSVAASNKPITFTTFDLAALSVREPKYIHHMLGDIIELFSRKVLRPVSPITTFSIANIEDAFRFLGSRKHIGKVVLTVAPSSMIKGVPAKPLPLQLRKDGTYIVAGGLGDLPSRICVFLASRGAGHIVSLSRRSIDDATKDKYMTAVKEHGGELHILQCDITDDDSMGRAVSYCSTLAPVRGVIHGAMLLRVSTSVFLQSYQAPSSNISY